MVISDRYSDSTVAYQCHGRSEPNYDYAGTLNLIRQSERSLVPEVTYYLRVEPEDAIERMRNSETHNSRFDKEPPEFHERVLRGFDVRARDYADRFVIIDGMLSMDEIESIIWKDFEQRLK